MKILVMMIGLTVSAFTVQASIKNFDPFVYVHPRCVCDTPPVIVTLLAQIDWTAFPGQTINYLLANIPAGFNVSNPQAYCKINTASGIQINYSDNVFIRVLVKDFQYFDPHSPRNTWAANLNLFKQETIWKVEVFDHEGNCMNDCD